MLFRNIFTCIIIFTLSSCAKAPLKKTYEKSGILISNYSQKSIKKITWKPCDAQNDTFIEIIESDISPGKSLFIDLKLNCVNLKVFNEFDTIISQLNGITLPPRFYWNIK